MASVFHALLGSILLLVLPLLPQYVHAFAWQWDRDTGAGAGSKGKIHLVGRNHRPRFVAGPWKHAHATCYEGSSGTFGMTN